ncbi:MAG: hypothetical protein HRU15_13635, partial [Planctomycetes bacterium]|nr:hypothetical protein [Planctomycetota bacterium]
MSDLSNASYVIRTKAGDKGPFTRSQIKKLVKKGQLPESVSVRDVATDMSVTVADIIQESRIKTELENAACNIASELTEDNDPFGDADDVSESNAETLADTPAVAPATRRTVRQTRRVSRANGEQSDEDAEGLEPLPRRRGGKKRKKQNMYLAYGVCGVAVLVALFFVMFP